MTKPSITTLNRDQVTSNQLDPKVIFKLPSPAPLASVRPTDLPLLQLPPLQAPPSVIAASALPRPRSLLGALAASAARLRGKDAKKSKILPSAWQNDAWDMLDLVGEQHFLTHTLANRQAQARLYIGTLNTDDPTDDPVQVQNAQITDLMNLFGRTPVGRTQLIQRMAVNLSIAGDGWFVGIPKHYLDPNAPKLAATGDGLNVLDLDWRVCSVSEVSTNHAGLVEIRVGEGRTDKIEAPHDELMLIRVWRPHPRYWWQADSPTKACLPILRQLVGLTEYVNAQINSRLSGTGLLLVPQGAARAIRIAAGLPDDDETDVFTEGLMEAMMTSIRDRQSAASVVPVVATVPDDLTDSFKLVEFSSPLDGMAPTLREESIRRLALGQDAPPELLLGTAGMNHWGAWLVREDVVSTHIAPPLALICDALTTQFLWPILESTTNLSREEIENHVVWFDVDQLVTRPNRGADAFLLHERGAIHDAALRDAVGFDQADGYSRPEDPAYALAFEMVKANPALLVEPGVAKIVADLDALMKGQPLSEPTTAPGEPVPGETPPPPAPAPNQPTGQAPLDGGLPEA